MKIVREITSCSYICGADMHFQNLHSADREGLRYKTTCKALHCTRSLARRISYIKVIWGLRLVSV